MALIVQKFGGTSVGSIERIQNVAIRVLEAKSQGHQVVVVTSAMSGETNRLIELASKINPIPYSRDYDLLVASGEQIAVGLLSLAINTEAHRRELISEGRVMARGYLGYQVGIFTDSVFSKARIRRIETGMLRRDLADGVIPVIAGFQGVDSRKNITTLGRGGSDTSAVALAAALSADVCDIFTDVDGVYTTDPRLCPKARKISKISYEEMMELASLGAKVLQIRSVELAAKHGVRVHVRSSFDHSEGTMVVPKEELGMMEQVDVSGVAADLSQVKFTLRNITDQPGLAAKVFGALSKEAIVVDIIVQDVPAPGKLTLSFTVGEADALKAEKVLGALKEKPLSGMEIVVERGLAKVSIVGVGMQNHPGVASKMFQILGEAGINIHLITTSEIKVSCLVALDQARRAVEKLHRGFGLDLVE